MNLQLKYRHNLILHNVELPLAMKESQLPWSLDQGMTKKKITWL